MWAPRDTVGLSAPSPFTVGPYLSLELHSCFQDCRPFLCALPTGCTLFHTVLAPTIQFLSNPGPALGLVESELCPLPAGRLSAHWLCWFSSFLLEPVKGPQISGPGFGELLSFFRGDSIS